MNRLMDVQTDYGLPTRQWIRFDKHPQTELVVHLSSTKLSVCDSASAETKREQSMLSYSPFMALRITFSGAK